MTAKKSTLLLLGLLYLVLWAAPAFTQTEPVVDFPIFHSSALIVRDPSLGPEHPKVVADYSYILSLGADRSRFLEQAKSAERLLTMADPEGTGEMGIVEESAYHSLAIAYQALGRYTEAELPYQRNLAYREKALGPDHPNVATNLNNLALVYQIQGKLAEAKPLYERALAIMEKVLGPNDWKVGETLNSLAVLYQTQENFDKAEQLHKRALAIRGESGGYTLNNLAELYHARGQYSEAERLYKRALAIEGSSKHPEYWFVAVVQENYAALLRDAGRTTEAKAMEIRAKAIRAKLAGK